MRATAGSNSEGARARAGTVLLVGAHRDLCRAIGGLLDLDGYAVITAHDSRAALSSARRHAPDIALVDVALPGEEPWRLCAQLLGGAHSPVPVLIFGAWDDPAARERAAAAGAQGYYCCLPPCAAIAPLVRRAAARPS